MLIHRLLLLPAACAMLLLGTAAPAAAHPEIPGAPQTRPVALVGATVHPVAGPSIENGTVVFEQGKITAVGKDVEIPAGAARVDLSGKHVYPSLFESYSNIGLVEINAVRATRDYSEAGRVNPNVKAQVSFNPDSELIPVTRSNGVLLALTAPTGGLISGKSAVMQLDGWTWEDMAVRAETALHINWPNMAPVNDWRVTASSREQAEARDRALKSIRQVFDDVEAYRQARQAGLEPPRIDARWEAMLPVIEGRLPVVVSANDVQQIQAAVAFAQKRALKLIILGGYDALHCAALLKQHNVPVIVSAVYRLPRRRFDDYDAAYTLPERLRAAGIEFCISGVGRFGASNVRNLPYHAATAVAYGLPREEGLKAITLYPARILGVDQHVGSIETGKDATLIVTDGDPLETTTRVERAYVQGRPVELNDRHKRLYRKYQEKYRRRMPR